MAWLIGPSVEQHLSYLDILKQHDPKAYALTKELLEKLENVQNSIIHKSMDQLSESLVRQTLHERVKELGMLPSSRGFMLVLIAADTDNFAFRDMFVTLHKAGGRLAAEELSARVKDYMRTLELSTDHTEVVVRIYGNIKQLEAALFSNQVMMSGDSLYPFVHGFNQAKSLFDFVDVRASHEFVERKTWECLDLFLDDPKCKHIVLGVRQDFSQGSQLRQLFADTSTRIRTTLLRDGPINPEMRALCLRKPLKLDTVFKSC